MDHSLGKTGDAPLKKVGHTVSGIFGSEPDARAKGPVGAEPTPITFK